MGVSASWISVAGLSMPELLARLGMEETDQVRPPHQWLRPGEFGCAELPSGRVMAIAENCEFFDEQLGARLSAGVEALVCQVEEHVMHAAAYGFRDGRLLWSIARHIDLPDEDEGSLIIKGTPPETFAAIRARNSQLRKEDPSVGYMWETIVEVATLVGRYRHDDDTDGFCPTFRVLEEAGSAERRAAIQAEAAARAAAKAEKAGAWKASGGLTGAVKRMFGGR